MGYESLRDPKIKKVIEADFGPPDNPSRASEDPLELIKKLPAGKIPQLYLAMGSSNFLLEQNREFVRLLSPLKVPYEYREVPGKHERPL